MKIHKIISESKDGERMEVVAVNKDGRCCTLHIHRYQGGWRYCAGHNRERKQRIFRFIER